MQRYLETKEVCKIGGILFVAPWLDLLPEAVADEDSYNTAQPWLNTPINFDKIKQDCPKNSLMHTLQKAVCILFFSILVK